MLASSFLDPVLGLDVHFEMVPTPAPVPTPIPNPFIGIVFDPLGLAAGIALGAAIGAVTGAPFQGPVLYWTAFPATNTGTEAKAVPGHILIPPGVAWAPFPKTPKPVIHPGETPKPALPIKPEDDAVVVFGSKTVTVMGSNAVRLGDIALSCSEPLRLPSAVVLAVPKGSPILIGGPPSLDIMAALMASLRTRFVSDSLHALLSRLKPSRFRNFLHRVVCFFTGHPVDVASGKVLTEFVDAELPGVLPFKFERIYSSAWCARSGPLGHGWSHSLNQAIWRERGKVVLLAEDGREIEFDTFALPEHRLQPGQSLHHPIERLTLHCDLVDADGREQWRVVDPEGRTRSFAGVPGRRDGWAMLQRVRSRCGFHEIRCVYDDAGRLAWVRDAVGRWVGFVHDAQGRLRELHLPNPRGEGLYRHRQYHYDDEGDLVEVVDSLDQRWRFSYVGHLLVRETDRKGESFHFAYDGLGEDAWCVRTWGDGGLYDHVLGYDKQKHITWVTNSLGHTTQYHMNAVGQVIQIVDPLGGVTRHEYDPRTLQRIAVTDPSGATTRYAYDERGHRTHTIAPDGSEARFVYDEHGPREAVDACGFEWTWTYDRLGRLATRRLPTGDIVRYEWRDALPWRATLPDGSQVHFEHDAHGNLRSVTDARGAKTHDTYDALGRLIAATLPTGATEHYRIDTEARVRRIEHPFGLARDYDYDAEGNLRAVRDAHQHVRFEYRGSRRLAARHEGEATLRFHYDAEDRLIAVENEHGERHEFERDARGDVVVERDYAGAVTRHTRDVAGRIVATTRASGRTSKFAYDVFHRLIEVLHDDGTFERFTYRPDGVMLSATNQTAAVRFECDPLGRILAEHGELADGAASCVRSTYGSDGRRVGVNSERGPSIVIERDVAGHTTRVQLPEHAWEVAFERDVLGNELARAVSSGGRATWQRDAIGRPLARAVEGRDFVREQRFTWEGESRLASVDDSVDGKVHYVRDARGRLVRAEGSLVPSCVRELDAVGNPHQRIDRRDRRYGSGGRLLERFGVHHEYDAEGRLIAKHEAERGTTRYAWDAVGMLTRVELPDGREVHFEYDALARRIGKRVLVSTEHGHTEREVRRRWIWDGNNPLTEVDEQNVAIHWIFEPESVRPLAKVTREGVHAALVDSLGTPTEWVDPHGRLAARSRVDLHGVLRTEMREREGAAPAPWGWPGQYHDEETGLCYNRFRYYDPAQGGYISPDPIGLLGGPHTRAYVPDPLLVADPFGLDYKTWQIHSPGYDDVIKKGLHFYAPGGLELAVRPNHTGGISFTNAIPGDANDRGLTAAIRAAEEHFQNNAAFRADILEKARAGVASLIDHAKSPQTAESLRNLANGRSREMRDIARNVERHENGGGCGK